MKVPQLTRRILAEPRQACIWSSQLSWMWRPDSKTKATSSTGWELGPRTWGLAQPFAVDLENQTKCK